MNNRDIADSKPLLLAWYDNLAAIAIGYAVTSDPMDRWNGGARPRYLSVIYS